MRSTLFHIPHADPWWGIPIFGGGWLLGIVVIVCLGLIAHRVYREGWKPDIWADIPILLVFAVIVGWLAPRLEEPSATGLPLGIPIRAYGVMVLLGIAAGIVMSLQQARRMGVDPEAVFSLCFWLVVAGFLGARIFYVIQKWDQFARPSVRETLVQIVNLTDGGLVVYGSFIGAAVVFVSYVLRYRLPLLAMADLLAPGMMIGLALGRIGCLMNGCCWGGVCDTSMWGITFPQGSPPFVDQLERGWLVGMRTQRDPVTGQMRVEQVLPDGLAAQEGLQAGDVITDLQLPDEEQFHRMRSGHSVADAKFSLRLADDRLVTWTFGELPPRSRPVYAAQLISAIDAALICLLLWAYYPFRRRDGEVFALMITIYPLLRILEEMIRSDEPSVLSANFRWTISQTVSSLLLLATISLWSFILSRPKGSVLPPRFPPARDLKSNGGPGPGPV
ncbi:MAG: prolipoprotein diacylglyceryl transferase [Pirellulaceae bacterium]